MMTAVRSVFDNWTRTGLTANDPPTAWKAATTVKIMRMRVRSVGNGDRNCIGVGAGSQVMPDSDPSVHG